MSEEASRYLYDELLERTQLSESASTVTQQLAIENSPFQKLLERLRERSTLNPESAQKEYVLLRSFLIENRYTTRLDLQQKFALGKTQFIHALDVGSLYDDCQENEVYWNCDRCGPLIKKRGRLYGSKSSFCGDHHESLAYVHQLSGNRELRRIKLGIHLRICLPGIHELELFRKMEALQQAHPEQLCAVLLYPELDAYDLQLHFGDQTRWAIDVKDYRNPHQLARKLLPIQAGDESFYVFPSYRVLNSENYIQIAREAATRLPASTHTLSDAEFEQQVIRKINRLKAGA